MTPLKKIALPLVFLSTCLLNQARAGTVSTDFGTIFVSKYFLFNNVWGQGDSPNGTESISNHNSTSPLNWSTTYNWPVNGHPYSVKAYPSVVSGWHWGTWSNNSGLPVRLWDNKNVNTSASVSVSNAGVQNVAYDCWFHTISNPTWEHNPTDELMIWTSTHNGAGPLGTLQGTATIGGATWRVYLSSGQLAWRVYSFVRTSNTYSWNYNIRDFINYVVYTKSWMPNSRYLTSVEFGTEVFSTNGQGKLTVNNYRCDVQ